MQQADSSISSSSASSSSSSTLASSSATIAMTAATAFSSGAPRHKVANNRGGGVWVAKSELAKVAAEVSKAKLEPESNGTPKVVESGGPSLNDGGDTTPAESASGEATSGSSLEKDVDSSSQHPQQSLTRQVSLSKLNAGAAVFVPKAASSPQSAGVFQPGQPGIISLAIPIPSTQSEAISTVETEEQNSLSLSAPSSQKSGFLSEELRAQVVQQVEFYFSDANLPTDSYLMKFIKKDSEGFVPIPVIGSFRKVKLLTKNYNALAAALRTSSKLVVSEDGKRVRRAEPLAEVDLDEIQARTVVAENLPEDHSIQSLEKLFGTVGSVKMVRVCEPGSANSINNSASSKHSKADRIVSNKLHAVVEYETVEQAEKAVAELTDQRNWRSGLHVRLLLRRMYPANKHNHATKPRKLSSEEEDGLEAKGEGASETAAQTTTSNDETAVPGTSEENSKRGVAVGRGRGRGRGRGSGASGRGAGSNHANGGMLGTSPQISCSPCIGESIVPKPPPGPRMPDGTRGFSFGRGSSKENHSFSSTASSSSSLIASAAP